MGKKGALLRAQKQKNVVYTFTAEQLKEHDKLILQAHKERLRDSIKDKVKEEVDAYSAKANAEIQQEWDKRAAEFASPDTAGNFMNMLQYLLAVSSRVLIEKFGWKPIPKDGGYDRRNRTARFADLVVDEIDKVSNDPLQDIRKYSDETYKLYGVKYTVEEE